MSNASNLSNLANVLDDANAGEFLKSTGSGGVAFDTVAAGAVVYATADLLPLSGFAAGDMAYVTATNRFYINNGSGWYSISLVNTNPNITSVADASSGTTPFTLATDQTATVITITAADPEEVPLTYGYSVTSGSLNGSTVAQGTGSNSNVFTVTPHASQDATFTITFTASDGINQATSANAFSLSFVTVVTDSKYTTLLATVPSFTAVPYSFADLSYQNKSFSFSSQGSMNAASFNATGTKMYAADYGGDTFHQYSLNPAWDISTASYDNVSLAFDSYSNSYTGLWFKPDGSVMYAADNGNDSIDIWTVSSGSEYVLNQYSYSSTKSLSAISGITDLRSIIFKSDGSKFFALCNDTYTVYEFTMASAWDVANAQHSSSNTYNVNTSAGENNPRSIYVTPDGTQLLMSGSNLDKLHRFVLTNPWEVNSATYASGDNFDFSGQAGTSIIRSILDGDGGKILYLSTSSSNTMFQYNFESVPKIIDSSSNNHSITVNGDAHAGTFSPYRSGGYSGLFDSTGVVQLSFAGSSDFEFGTGNFTIEMWFKWNSSNKSDTTIFSNRISATSFDTGDFFFHLLPGDNTSGGIEFAFDCGTPRYRLQSGGNLTANDAFFNAGWHHYAAVRNGTSLKLFVDGQEVDEITLPVNETNFGNSSDNIGLGANPSLPDGLAGPDGEYRDVRIVKGVAITPPSGGPTEPLAAVSGTTLLLYNGEGYLKDKSTSNHSPIYGSTVPTITATGPFDYNKYAATDHGGSVYFDGNNDYLDVSDASLDLDGYDWSIEAWWYPTNLSQQNQVLIDTRPDISLLILLNRTGSGDTYIYTGNGSGGYIGSPAIDSGSNSPIIESRWNHVSLVKNGSIIYLYHNGQQVGSSAYLPSGFNGTMRIGAYESSGSSGDYLYGYISDLRIVKGTAVYTGGFTPPSGPLTTTGGTYSITTNVNTSIPSSNTKLHIKGTDASIIDKSQSANLKLFGDTTGSTTQVKFSNTKSMYFDGSGDYIEGPTISDLNIGTGDFTVECWLYETTTNTNKGVWDGRSTYNTTDGFAFIRYGTNTFRVYSGSVLIDTGSFTIQNQWVHCALVRSSGTLSVYINGNSSGSSVSNSTNFSSSGTLKIGGGMFTSSTPTTPNAYITGYIQDFRVSNYARYTAADETSNIPSAPLEG